jgi:hypothetical protein
MKQMGLETVWDIAIPERPSGCADVGTADEGPDGKAVVKLTAGAAMIWRQAEAFDRWLEEMARTEPDATARRALLMALLNHRLCFPGIAGCEPMPEIVPGADIEERSER